MVAKGKGKDYYKSTYTHEQLWEMLQVGDDWRVEQAGSVWTSAASGMKAAREEMAVHVSTLRTQWTGAASDEFESRMSVVEEYSIESENGMKRAGEITMPDLAGYLRTAQSDAQGADLYPSSTETYDEWLESQDIDKTKPEYETKKVQYQQQYEQYLDQRHEAMAQIVADLGDRYARAKEEDFSEPPPPPPSDMPGNSTYQAPTGGVFADSGLSNSNDVPDAPGGNDSLGADTSGADGIVGTGDDLDPVDSNWTPGSYDDIDNGGLANGGLMTGGGGGGGTGYMGGGGGGTGLGASSLTGAGAGLFGPARGTTPVGGAGNAPGRGAGSTSPARAGASSGNRTGSGTGGRGAGSGSGGRGTGSGSRPGSSSGRGGTRSGYYDDDDEETYTRETWLREDDVDWGRNRVSDDELDED
ncbi:hypothetical protein [Glycomyces artemisiae]|uniref:PPE family protein n=1 Tax=Glycomyces artemisiae TaxID=1076443 RepID=A0A2T0U8H7_9ACTN|nr:hypothetical protein [Glycomyces artemisiae]PRY54158.1 hypothetical protein B0I28_11512 [Glycomyces artemisiae]